MLLHLQDRARPQRPALDTSRLQGLPAQAAGAWPACSAVFVFIAFAAAAGAGCRRLAADLMLRCRCCRWVSCSPPTRCCRTRRRPPAVYIAPLKLTPEQRRNAQLLLCFIYALATIADQPAVRMDRRWQHFEALQKLIGRRRLQRHQLAHGRNGRAATVLGRALTRLSLAALLSVPYLACARRWSTGAARASCPVAVLQHAGASWRNKGAFALNSP